MIYCLSCEKYPTDTKVIPYGSDFPIDTFKVRLLTNEKPTTMPVDGTDVEDLADGTKFSVGSLLYVVDSNGESEVYIYVDDEFKLWNSPVWID